MTIFDGVTFRPDVTRDVSLGEAVGIALVLATWAFFAIQWRWRRRTHFSLRGALRPKEECSIAEPYAESKQLAFKGDTFQIILIARPREHLTIEQCRVRMVSRGRLGRWGPSTSRDVEVGLIRSTDAEMRQDTERYHHVKSPQIRSERSLDGWMIGVFERAVSKFAGECVRFRVEFTATKSWNGRLELQLPHQDGSWRSRKLKLAVKYVEDPAVMAGFRRLWPGAFGAAEPGTAERVSRGFSSARQ